jgi:IclR family transcriptional regulator, pca regulon regulatory protein
MDNRSTDETRDKTLDVKNVVRSLAKGFRILEAFKPDEAEMTLSQIAARTNLDSGTTFRLINTLVSLGYLARVDGARRYRLGLKVLDLGFSTIGGMDVVRNARPILRSLLDGIAYSANLDVLDGTEIVRVERVLRNVHRTTGSQRIGLRSQGLGSRTSLECTVMGQAAMAYVAGSYTIDEGTLTQIRKRGYVHRGGKGGDEDHIIAAASLDGEGRARAVVSVTCPNSVCSEEEFVSGYAKRLVHAARRIGRLFDFAGTPA